MWLPVCTSDQRTDTATADGAPDPADERVVEEANGPRFGFSRQWSPASLRCVDTEDLRLAVYERFRRGEIPRVATLASGMSTTPEQVSAGLASLAAGRHLALGQDGGITMAHPFTAVPLGFSVMGRDSLWWGGCAWDSFALPHLLPDQAPMLVATTCPACEQAHAWQVDDHEPPVGDQVAHFLVPTARMWDDVVFTCSNQRIFCSETCVTAWLDRSGRRRGYVMDLPTLWRLAPVGTPAGPSAATSDASQAPLRTICRM
jgi:hypothetical protein